MKIYKLEFQYFSGCDWKNNDVEITTVNKIQIIRAFINSTSDIHNKYEYTSEKQLRKDLWNECKSDIEEINLPLIIKK